MCATKIGAGSSNTSLRAVPEKEVFSFKEAQEFLKMLDGLSDDIINQRVCLKILLYTGIRNAELHGLRWSDIDLDNNVLHVRRNRLYSQEFGIYEKEPKTKTSIRDIPMPSSLVDDLKNTKTGLDLQTTISMKSWMNTILPSGLTDSLCIHKLWDIGSQNLKQSMVLSMLLVTDLGIHIAVCSCLKTCLFKQ